MNGPAKYAERIPVNDGGNDFPADSYFIVRFTDGSEVSEKDVNWSSFSEQKTVAYFQGRKQVRVSKYPVKSITVRLGDLEETLEVPEGCEAYQAIRSRLILIPNKTSKGTTVGRCVGIVKDDEVIEERFLNGAEHATYGMRK